MMEDDFNFSEDPKFSVERYEKMIRNKDQYFFDSQAFDGIIDYYIDKNDAVKALQVAEYAGNQHPYDVGFFYKKAQLYLAINKTEEAFLTLEKAESLEPSNADIYLIRGSAYSLLSQYGEAMEQYSKALEFAEKW